jgi:hypothetical protein
MTTKKDSYNELFTKGLSVKPVIIWFDIAAADTEQQIIYRHSEHTDPCFNDIHLTAYLYHENTEYTKVCLFADAKYGAIQGETYNMTNVARLRLKHLTDHYKTIWSEIEEIRREAIIDRLKTATDKYCSLSLLSLTKTLFTDRIFKTETPIVYQRIFYSKFILEAVLNNDNDDEPVFAWLWRGERYTSLEHIIYAIRGDLEIVGLLNGETGNDDR